MKKYFSEFESFLSTEEAVKRFRFNFFEAKLLYDFKCPSACLLETELGKREFLG